MDFDNRAFTTEYRGNYVRHKVSPLVKHGTKQEFKDPIVEGFKHFLSTGKDAKKPIENCHQFMDRVEASDPKVKAAYFPEPLKTDLVNEILANEKDTSYHDHYCRFAGHEKYLPCTKVQTVPLPEGWVEGTTTQRFAYRNPVILFPNIYNSRPNLIKAPCEMDEAHKHSIKSENVSEFGGTIGVLGKFILDNEMHGSTKKISL